MLKSANKSLYTELEETRKAHKELESKYAEAKKVVKALKQEVRVEPCLTSDPNKPQSRPYPNLYPYILTSSRPYPNSYPCI